MCTALIMHIATPVLLLFLLAQVPSSECLKCRKLKGLTNVDWNKFDKTLWVQLKVNKPHTVTQCIARSYRPNKGQVHLRAIGGVHGQTWNISKVYDKGEVDGDTIRFKHGRDPHFYQILDTDYKTWIIEHKCSNIRGDAVSLMYHKPVHAIPSEVLQKAVEVMRRSGLPADTTLSTTDCMLTGGGISVDVQLWFEVVIKAETF
ncbi:uncharacterized protein LOC119464562 [Dermacentor silvarum]|uniref:uncharacterized protein LOC119464562 n=1 Tax=Dermacentor silvarum TaxID=543639 RepID=UPI001899A0FD|nr:uncharacterized protein LOC119464562 [Dermacentor silvarum]